MMQPTTNDPQGSQSPNDEASKPSRDKLRFMASLKENLSTIGILLLAPLLAVFMINFVFQTYEVDGPSMETTLYNKDRLIVLKTEKTLADVKRDAYIPDRYAVVVFNHQGDYGFGGTITEKQLIKRVIGLPGDRVVIKDGEVKIYNPKNPNGFLVDSVGPEAQVIGVTSGNIDQTVGKDQVFVMGDNRENSLDSRSFGPVSSKDLVGKLAVRIYPFDKIQRF